MIFYIQVTTRGWSILVTLPIGLLTVAAIIGLVYTHRPCGGDWEPKTHIGTKYNQNHVKQAQRALNIIYLLLLIKQYYYVIITKNLF